MLNYNISRLVVASVNPSQIGLIRLKSLEFASVSLATCSPSTSKFSGRCYASYTTNKNPKGSQSGKVDVRVFTHSFLYQILKFSILSGKQLLCQYFRL